MVVTEILMVITILLLGVSAFGYILTVLKEKIDLFHNQVHIPSQNLTQRDMDSVELKAFRVGKVNLMTGDQIKVYLKGNVKLRGTVIGARKKDNSMYIVTEQDELVTLRVQTIRKLRVVTRYGKIF